MDYFPVSCRLCCFHTFYHTGKHEISLGWNSLVLFYFHLSSHTLLALWHLCTSFHFLYIQFLVCLLLGNCTGRKNGFLKSSLLLCFLSFQWRTKFRKAMNKADNDASTRVIDSLINYEVSISFTNTNVFIYLCCLLLSLI